MYQVRLEDLPYIKAIKSIQGKAVTSDQIETAVSNVNQAQYENRSGEDVIRLMRYFDLIQIESHLGQPRHGSLINHGRLHRITVEN